MRILGIDPGTIDSAFVIWDADSKRIIDHNESYHDGKENKHKQKNEDVLRVVETRIVYDILACEWISAMGMAVGAEVFVTALWVGRFVQAAYARKIPFCLIPRQTLKFNMCNSAKANDSTIRMALMDRFGKPGTKKDPGLTFPLHADMWQAFAVCITADDLKHKIVDNFIRW